MKFVALTLFTLSFLIRRLSGSKSLSVAVFVQIGNINKLDDLMQCAGNVVEAKRLVVANPEKWLVIHNAPVQAFTLDIFVSHIVHQPESSTSQAARITNKIESFGPLVNDHYIAETTKDGLDVGQFLRQLGSAESMQKSYDVALKIHSKANKGLAQYTNECLCGTPAQVLAILNQFAKQPEIEMVVPKGMIFSPITQKDRLHPVVLDTYIGDAELATAFGPANVVAMESIYKTIFGTPLATPFDKLLYVAGTMFWVRYPSLRAKELTAALPALAERWSKGYVRDSGIEHALQRLIPTWIAQHGGRIVEFIPAPKVLAMYFPQYHQIPENDRFHGVGFTEWTLLRPLQDYPSLMKPLPEEQGGLGYYNLTEHRIRKKQAELARIAGVHGFVYYHYWFSGPKAPDGHLVMHRIPELMLLDGQPDRPFMLSWANEPWTRTWVGLENDILLSQEYGNRDDWIVHFYYLLKFFRHPKYIRVDDMPVFAIYRLGHVGDKLQPILYLWNKLALQNGLPGIHFVATIGNFVKRDQNTFDIWKTSPELKGAFHFRPQLRDPFNEEYSTASMNDVPLPVKTIQYWGAFTNFDARPRRPDATPVRPDLSPGLFGSELRASFAAMVQSHARFVSPNLYFVTAWNEWNEQAVLEPDNKNGFGYLLALKTAVENVEGRMFDS